MKTNALSTVRRLFAHPDVPPSVARHNQRQWVQKVRQLGNKHLLANPVQRKEQLT